MKKEFNGPWLYQWKTSHLLSLKDKKEIIDLTKLVKSNKVVPYAKDETRFNRNHKIDNYERNIAKYSEGANH